MCSFFNSELSICVCRRNSRELIDDEGRGMWQRKGKWAGVQDKRYFLNCIFFLISSFVFLVKQVLFHVCTAGPKVRVRVRDGVSWRLVRLNLS